MANHTPDSQISFITQWFRTWSDYQKDDFVHILSQKLAPGQYVNGIVNGVQNLDTTGRPPSLFSCQVKLFNEWWDTWNEGDRAKMSTQFADSDTKFWSEVQAELNGKRKTADDEFFTLIANTMTTNNVAASANTTQNQDETTKSANNSSKEVVAEDEGIQVEEETGGDEL